MLNLTADLTADFIQARVLYRDGLILVIDKPAGIPVHQGPGGGYNLETSFEHLRYGLPKPPALGHRLDRDTSGCLVLGRHRKALARLGKLFAGGGVDKTYWAVVKGIPASPAGQINLPLVKLTPKHGWRMVVSDDGQDAITDYVTLGSCDNISWLALYPRTGRTHQIRVHCSAINTPILGEKIYNDKADKLPLHLHARSITIPLYPNRPPITITADPPAHMLAALEKCGYKL